MQDSITETQSSGSKKRRLKGSIDKVGRSLYLDTEESYKRWELPQGLAI